MPRAAKPHHRRSSATPPPRRRRVISPRPRMVEEEGPEVVEQALPHEELHQPAFHHEEKRRLILAHAQARRERPKGFGFFHYVAVVASCLVVMVGWWMTMERSFTVAPASGESFSTLFQDSLDNAARQQEQLFPSNRPDTNLDRRLNQADQEVRGRNAAEERVMDQTARRLLQPLSSSTAATTTR